MATIKPLSVSAKRLAQTITGSSSSFKLDNILSWNGSTNLAASDLGTKAYVAFRNSAGTLVEFMEIDPATIADTSITILRRGLKYNGDDLTTEVSANKLTWVKGDTIVELGTHLPQLLAHMVTIVGNQNISGVKTFSDFPVKSGSLTPISTEQLAPKAYVDLVAGGSASYDQNLVTGTAGEDLVAGAFVYFKTSDQKWWKTSSAAAATSKYVKLGVAQATIATDASGVILIGGIDKTQTGLTAGSAYFLTTAGGISTTPGTYRRFVGWANSTTELFLDANNDIDNLNLDGAHVYAADSVGTDAYAITLPVAITAYSDGMRFCFKAGTSNTGNATLAVSGLTAKNILKNYNVTLSDNDIVAGQMIQVVFDSANDVWQMISPASTSLTASSLKFGGDGSDGVLNITSGTTNIDLGSAAYVVKNYTSINITAGATLGFTNPHANGTIVILRSQGAVTIAGTITANYGGAGGAGGNDANGNSGSDNDDILDTDAHYGAGGVKGASGGAGGAAGAVLSQSGAEHKILTYTTSTTYLYRRTLMITCGSGGGGGGAANGGNASDRDMTAVAGGRGGGGLLIECAGAWNFTGTISIAGTNGTDGSRPASYTSGVGGGGGGGGGHLVVLYNTLTANSGTVDKGGGNGGNALAANWDANSAGSGGGGGGAGVLTAGGAGGNAGSGANPGANGSDGGGTDGGTHGNGSNFYVLGGGGGGGGGGGTGTSLITKNLWFT